MSSAILVSPNAAHWGDRKVYMRKYAATNTKTTGPLSHATNNHNPTSRPVQIHDHLSNLHSRDRTFPPQPSLPLRGQVLPVALNEHRESWGGAYVTFNLGVYTKSDLKNLKKRLVSELEQVRAIKTRLEAVNTRTRTVHTKSQLPPNRQPPVQVRKLAPTATDTKPVSQTPILPQSKRKTPGKGTKRANSFSTKSDSKQQEMYRLTEKTVASMMKRCGQILCKLMKQKSAWVFNKPVDVVGMGLFDYHQIIKKPMDLGTVKLNLDNNVYNSPSDFAADVRLTFDNALVYNPKEHDVHIMASQLLTKFNDTFDPAYKKFKDEHIRVTGRNWARVEDAELFPKVDKMPALVERAVEQEKVVAVVDSRRVAEKLVKPTMDINKGDMSFEEKQKLGKELEELPAESMGQLLLIVKKRCGQLVQNGDEIELDIDLMDTETLWELDRFVANCKRMIAKVKRQALSENTNQRVSPATVREGSPVSEKEDVGGQYKVVPEEDVDIGEEEIPACNYPPVEIEREFNTTGCASGKSGSRSSSSFGSGSSSSSSDAGSSSGSDSDVYGGARSDSPVEKRKRSGIN